MLAKPILVITLLISLQCAAKYFCPPVNFVTNSQRSISGVKTAIITEIHGQLWAKTHSWGPFWTEYYNGDQLSRNLFNHAGVLGVDKIYMGVFYNESLYPNGGPSVEDIYPSRKYCVSEWHKLGVLEWRPLPYGGPVSNWPLDKDGNPTQDRDYYKTLRAYNPIYAEIRKQYDWVFVMDPDEYLTPVNFDVNLARNDWCSSQYRSFLSRILLQMLAIATRHKLSTFDVMMSAYNQTNVLSGQNACRMGLSYDEVQSRCRPITSFTMPVYLWLSKSDSPEFLVPTIRSKLPGSYTDRLKAVSQDGQDEMWKSAYQTRHSTLLEGRTLHDNPADARKVFAVLAPRAFHGSLSLEIVHQRNDNLITNETFSFMMEDRRLVSLVDSYKHCMQALRYNDFKSGSV